MRPPLVVLPHGGPIGVQDTREFDPVVQSLAARGYAVLQVNYRGSAGKGVGFLEAGLGAWGQGIEDDIEAALDTVEAKQLVDADRVCIFGGSYGGYSALIGITRRPQRYRCAAAFAAPTDLLLLSSEYLGSEDGERVFAKMVGDPKADREHLIAIRSICSSRGPPATRSGLIDRVDAGGRMALRDEGGRARVTTGFKSS